MLAEIFSQSCVCSPKHVWRWHYCISASFVLQQNEDLKRQLTAQQKLLDKHKDTISRCQSMTKQLLIAKVGRIMPSPTNFLNIHESEKSGLKSSCCFFCMQSQLEKKTAREKCMENRLRLGQFVTQRQGASFVENWVDGYAFTDLIKCVSLRMSRKRVHACSVNASLSWCVLRVADCRSGSHRLATTSRSSARTCRSASRRAARRWRRSARRRTTTASCGPLKRGNTYRHPRNKVPVTCACITSSFCLYF